VLLRLVPAATGGRLSGGGCGRDGAGYATAGESYRCLGGGDFHA